MTNEISLEALEGKTVGEIIDLAKQAENLPVGFKFTYKKPKENFAEKLLEEIENEK